MSRSGRCRRGPGRARKRRRGPPSCPGSGSSSAPARCKCRRRAVRASPAGPSAPLRRPSRRRRGPAAAPGQRQQCQSRVHAVRPRGKGARVPILRPAHGEPVVIAPAAAGTLPGQEQPDRPRDIASESRPRLFQVEEVIQQIGCPERVHLGRLDATDLPVQPVGRPLGSFSGPRAPVAVELARPEVQRPGDERGDGYAVRPRLSGRRPCSVPSLRREQVVDCRADRLILVRDAVEFGAAPAGDGLRPGVDPRSGSRTWPWPRARPARLGPGSRCGSLETGGRVAPCRAGLLGSPARSKAQPRSYAAVAPALSRAAAARRSVTASAGRPSRKRARPASTSASCRNGPSVVASGRASERGIVLAQQG